MGEAGGVVRTIRNWWTRVAPGAWRDRRLFVTHISVYGDEMMVGPLPGLSAAIRWAERLERTVDPAAFVKIHGHYEVYTPRQARHITGGRRRQAPE